MKVRIIVDSSADVSERVRQRLTVVPLTVRFGDHEYIDGVTITRQEFYEKLIESDELPSTSQATPDSFSKEFAEVAAKGECAVVLTISSKLSGTYQSAMIAAEDYPDCIFVVDGKSAATGSGILAERALQLADGGMDAKEIAEQLTEERENVCLIALLDTLEYLKKGGRISSAVALAGSLLSIKPVMHMSDEGKLTAVGKARGRKGSLKALVDAVERSGAHSTDLQDPENVRDLAAICEGPASAWAPVADEMWACSHGCGSCQGCTPQK